MEQPGGYQRGRRQSHMSLGATAKDSTSARISSYFTHSANATVMENETNLSRSEGSSQTHRLEATESKDHAVGEA